ncbi:enoyl-CoA hydratase-related protein, partial [Acinetobacter junii]|uniref:enoyl-CoA hydratase-related protein n=1 Tax=Acinetobacter junii TaxID=40215 RepID=UPI003AF547C9
PEGAASRLLVKQAGYQKAAELLFTAKKFDAATAVKANLVNDVVEDAYATAQQTAQHLAALPLASLKQSKALMKKDFAEILACVDEEAEIFMQRVR